MPEYLKILKTIKALASLIIVFACFNTPVPAGADTLLVPFEPGARMFLLPDKQTYLDPDNLILNLIIDPEQKSFNAARVNINFPADILTIKKINYASSSCPMLAREIIDNHAGRAEFACGTSTRELNARTAIARIEFNKIKAGWAKINLNKSKVLAADGLGANVLNSAEIHNLLIIK